MSIDFKEVKNDFNKLSGSLKPGGKKYASVKTEFLRLAINQENELKETLPEGATSNLVNSTYNEVEINGLNFNGVIGAKQEYGIIAAETGRRPGKAPPAKQLKRWARQKLGDENAAYAVAKKIAKKGTRRYIEKGPKLITKFEGKLNNFAIPTFTKNVADIIIQ